ncbi:MAG: polyhydroxyalkanoate synthesis regulator phasin [Parvicellaceae bacterium]|jgi:polyhydroxyalkanoate synthesis regulator phasin
MRISAESFANAEVVNHQLSEERAQDVVDYLVKKNGIDKDRVIIDVHDLKEDSKQHSKDL